jgi:hypothetical protein
MKLENIAMAACLALLAIASTSMADDAYIEATGSQVVSLNRKMTPTTRWEVDFALTDTTAQQRIFGARGLDSDEGKMELYINSEGKWAFGAKAGGYGTSFAADTERRVAAIDPALGKGYIITGADTNAVSAGKFVLSDDSDYPMTVFGMAKNADGTLFENWGLAKARVYGFKVWDGDDLVMEGVPAIRDCVAGFYDTVGGGFYTSLPSVDPLLYGGDINRDDRACLVSDGEQVINTKYVPTLLSRIEVDSQMDSHTGSQERIFGVTRSEGNVAYGLYCNGNVAGKGNFSFGAGDYDTGSFPSFDTGVAVDFRRHAAIIDFKNKKVHFITGVVTNFTSSFSLSNRDPTWLVGLFGEPYTAAFEGSLNRSAVKIFSAKAYDDDVLVHHWLPYKDAEKIGLKDVITGTIFVNWRGAETQFQLYGCGWGDDGDAFYAAPTNAALDVRSSCTLSAFAPGAVSYQWKLADAALPGETGLSYEASWCQPPPRFVPVSVEALFNVGGATVSRSASAVLSMSTLPGLVVMFR